MAYSEYQPGASKPDLSFLKGWDQSGGTGNKKFDDFIAEQMGTVSRYVTPYAGKGYTGGNSRVQRAVSDATNPFFDLRKTLGNQEFDLLTSLTEQYKLYGTNIAEDKTRSGAEIADAAKTAETNIGKYGENLEQSQKAIAGAQGATAKAVTSGFNERQAQMLKAIEASGGDASATGAANAAAAGGLSREQAAAQSALARSQAVASGGVANAKATTGLVNQSAVTTLENNFRKADQALKMGELKASTDIKNQFSMKRAELDFQIAQATVQAQKEEEAMIRAEQEAARAAAAARAQYAASDEDGDASWEAALFLARDALGPDATDAEVEYEATRSMATVTVGGKGAWSSEQGDIRGAESARSETNAEIQTRNDNAAAIVAAHPGGVPESLMETLPWQMQMAVLNAAAAAAAYAEGVAATDRIRDEVLGLTASSGNTKRFGGGGGSVSGAFARDFVSSGELGSFPAARSNALGIRDDYWG